MQFCLKEDHALNSEFCSRHGVEAVTINCPCGFSGNGALDNFCGKCRKPFAAYRDSMLKHFREMNAGAIEPVKFVGVNGEVVSEPMGEWELKDYLFDLVTSNSEVSLRIHDAEEGIIKIECI